jgi:hypothetical protein
MTKNRKILLTVVKLAVAGMLLALVCSMAHWRDYVVGLKDATFQIRDGSTVEIKKDAAYVILADQPGLPATLAVREVPRVDLTSKIKPSSGLVGELASWGRRLAAPVEAFSSSASSKEPLRRSSRRGIRAWRRRCFTSRSSTWRWACWDSWSRGLSCRSAGGCC